MPPKISKLTNFLSQQKKTIVSDKLKTDSDTKETLKLESFNNLCSSTDSTSIKNDSPIQLEEKQDSNNKKLPEMSLKRARTTRSQVSVVKNIRKEQLSGQAKISDFILKTPQKQQILTGKANAEGEVINKEVKSAKENISDQEFKVENKEITESKDPENSQVKPIPAYLKYGHLLNKPIHKRYEDESMIDKLAPPQLVAEGPRACSSTMPEKNKLPSFLKYKHLVPLREKKALPRTFESLKRNFNALSNIILFNKSKNQIVIYHKIQSSIQMISKQDFSIENLGQLKYILGDYLNCKKVEIVYKGEKVNSWELNLLDNNNEQGENLWTTDKEFESKQINQNIGQKLEFLLKDKLYGIVEEAHKNFLTTNNLINENEFEWHPKFNVESLNDKIPCHPEISEINRNKEIAKPKIDEAPSTFDQLINVAKSSAKRPTDFSAQAETKSVLSIKDRRAALLEKIKAKQALKEQQQKETTGNGLGSKKILMIDQLLNLLNSIHLIFQYNDRKPIMLDDIAQKLLSGQNCRLDKFEVIDHLRLLKELVPDFCIIEPLKNSKIQGELIRLNSKIELNKVRFALNKFKQG